jgi:hypothetical protein
VDAGGRKAAAAVVAARALAGALEAGQAPSLERGRGWSLGMAMAGEREESLAARGGRRE